MSLRLEVVMSMALKSLTTPRSIPPAMDLHVAMGRVTELGIRIRLPGHCRGQDILEHISVDVEGHIRNRTGSLTNTLVMKLRLCGGLLSLSSRRLCRGNLGCSVSGPSSSACWKWWTLGCLDIVLESGKSACLRIKDHLVVALSHAWGVPPLSFLHNLNFCLVFSRWYSPC